MRLFINKYLIVKQGNTIDDISYIVVMANCISVTVFSPLNIFHILLPPSPLPVVMYTFTYYIHAPMPIYKNTS